MPLIDEFTEYDIVQCRQNGLSAVTAVFAVAGSHRVYVRGEYQTDDYFILQDSNLPL
jgi:hypothetical protein